MLANSLSYTFKMNGCKKVFMSYMLFVILCLLHNVSSMTRQQVKQASKLMKKNCMPKNDVTEEQVGEIEQGKFLEERNVMCYIACIFTMGGAVKNNKIFHEGMIKQVDMMFPAEMKEAGRAYMEKCKPVAKQYKDICEASYYYAKCCQETDPANFLFP